MIKNEKDGHINKIVDNPSLYEIESRYFKVRIIGKREQFREKNIILPYTVVAYKNGAFGSSKSSWRNCSALKESISNVSGKVMPETKDGT